jgi:hypothetical protein
LRSNRLRLNCISKIEIVSEVLAEGWVRSLTDWYKKNRRPVCFHQPVLSMPVSPELFPPLPPLPVTADIERKES